jgi:serine/threonine protein kinase
VNPERRQEVKKVLAGALERTPPERHSYLDQACPDASLRREVESLIAAHEQGDSSFMERPAVGSNEMLMSGTKLGPYEIIARLGAGGMGVVYRARDGRLERDVAIKVLPLGLLADEAARKRFRKEALALAKLNHPNIAVVYDVGEQEGTDFLVMECVPGNSLAEELGSSLRTEKEAVALGTQIAAALEEAHEQGIVHRDLKPGNIMVTPKRQVKVLDFGLAKILRAAGESSTTESFSQTQNLAGTLPYMAPEQLRGEPADARTDVHALGAVLFEIVTGKRPYRENSVPQLTDAILHQQPVAPRALNARCRRSWSESS